MRKQDKVIIWPSYFDSTKTKKEGRRISKNLGVPAPKIQEIKDAAEKVGLEYELVQDAGYPRTSTSLKAGMLLVKKNEAKQKIVLKIARQLLKIRSSTPTTK